MLVLQLSGKQNIFLHFTYRICKTCMNSLMGFEEFPSADLSPKPKCRDVTIIKETNYTE